MNKLSFLSLCFISLIFCKSNTIEQEHRYINTEKNKNIKKISIPKKIKSINKITSKENLEFKSQDDLKKFYTIRHNILNTSANRGCQDTNFVDSAFGWAMNTNSANGLTCQEYTAADCTGSVYDEQCCACGGGADLEINCGDGICQNYEAALELCQSDCGYLAGDACFENGISGYFDCDMRCVDAALTGTPGENNGNYINNGVCDDVNAPNGINVDCSAYGWDFDSPDCVIGNPAGGNPGNTCALDFDVDQFGYESCDHAWYELGLTCSDIETTLAQAGWPWYYNCTGCQCPGDSIADGGAGGGADGGEEGCEDYDNGNGGSWHDIDGQAFDCQWYVDGGCPNYGDQFSNFGYNALEACCGCGGGNNSSSSGGSTGGTTDDGGGSVCLDTDNGATDINGNTCAVYTGLTCLGGMDDDDFISQQMCCVCGGGSIDGETDGGETDGGQSCPVPELIGNGECDHGWYESVGYANIPECQYDGGDCCPSTNSYLTESLEMNEDCELPVFYTNNYGLPMVDLINVCLDPNSEDNQPGGQCTEDGSSDGGGSDGTDTCTGLTVVMVDAWNDGWSGNILTIGSESFTIESGGLVTECYTGPVDVPVTCGGGNWQVEVSWTILDGDEIILYGGAPYSGCLGTCDDGGSDGDDSDGGTDGGTDGGNSYPDCPFGFSVPDANGMNIDDIGDGVCDTAANEWSSIGDLNNAVCGWDGGDCCPSTNSAIDACSETTISGNIFIGFTVTTIIFCQDPDSIDNQPGGQCAEGGNSGGACTSSEWECDDGQCITGSWLCDGSDGTNGSTDTGANWGPDCSDGSDEMVSVCCEENANTYTDLNLCTPEICDDGIDNDSDGEVDCDDYNCSDDVLCGGTGACGDGYILDCADTDCCDITFLDDNYCDGTDQEWDCNLVCYDNDGGDCEDVCPSGIYDCEWECDGTAVLDECDVCSGDGTSCVEDVYGDLNEDGSTNIVDIVLLVDIILSNSDDFNASADLNDDSTVNIVDVVLLVNFILGE